MKTISAALGQHLDGEVTTLATCWRLERADGWTRGFTDHDKDLEVDGLVYTAATGFLPSAIKSGSDLSVDNLGVEGFLDDDALRPEDLTAGLFDGARIEIFLVNWADLSQGRIILRKGWLGEVKRADSRFSAEILGLANKLQQTQGILYSRLCRVDLGSPECGVDLGPLTDEYAIETVTAGDGFTALPSTRRDPRASLPSAPARFWRAPTPAPPPKSCRTSTRRSVCSRPCRGLLPPATRCASSPVATRRRRPATPASATS
jgi:hypothetical protein